MPRVASGWALAELLAEPAEVAQEQPPPCLDEQIPSELLVGIAVRRQLETDLLGQMSWDREASHD